MMIDSEIKHLLAESIIEPSNSPWWAQVIITAKKKDKKRLCIDYSQTINYFTHLDTYLLPRIGNQVNEIANVKIFSMLDLKSTCQE